MAGFKSAVTKRINELRHTPGAKLWQRSYYEHVIRNEHELNRAREYIINDPAEWTFDRENPSATVAARERRCNRRDCRGDRPVAPTAGPRPRSLGALMAGFKSAVTKRINELRHTPGAKLWQRSYYEHVIRNEHELNRARECIINNPAEWAFDRENPSATVAARERRCNRRDGRGDRPVAPTYLYLLFTGMRPLLLGAATLNTQLNLNIDRISAIDVIQPPLDEQTAIADFLDHETDKIDALVAKVETAIERLHEYRTALITAAVTDKIDVREEVV